MNDNPRSSNGRTVDFGSAYLGSNPSLGAWKGGGINALESYKWA